MKEFVSHIIEKRSDHSLQLESEDESTSLFDKIIKKATTTTSQMTSKEGREGTLKKQLDRSLQLIENPTILAKSMSINSDSSSVWLTIRNLVIFLAIRFIFFKSNK